MPTQSVQDIAREQEAQAQRIAAVQTQMALDYGQATVETIATQQAAQRIIAATSAPVRETATARARQAQVDALATMSVVEATATVAAAEIVANAEATRTVLNAENQAHVADAQAVLARSAAAARQAWLARCVAALQLTGIAAAPRIATTTATVEAAQAAARKEGFEINAIHDPAKALAECQKAAS